MEDFRDQDLDITALTHVNDGSDPSISCGTAPYSVQ